MTTRRVFEKLAELILPVFLHEMTEIANSANLSKIFFESKVSYEGQWQTVKAVAYGRCYILHPCMTQKNGDPREFTLCEDGQNDGIPVHDIFKAWCSDFVVKNFGKDKAVKTSNISLKTLLEGKTRGKEKMVVEESFYDWFRIYYESDYIAAAKDIFKKRQQEISEQFHARVSEMEPQRTEALVQWAMRDIKSVLVKYRDVDTDKIREAIQTAQVNMVLDF